MTTTCRAFLSNRLEDVVELLAHNLRQPLADPFEPECVIVQSQGMARYLSLELARRWGICANIRFQFPVVFFYQLFRILLEDTPEDYAFAKERMAWELMEILPEYARQPQGQWIAGYLREDETLTTWQLAEKIAYHFDQYLIFRPDMIQAWEQGKTVLPGNDHEPWQAALWRELAARLGKEGHRAALTRRFLERLAAVRTLPRGFPQRIAVFGISSLPPLYLDILAALGRHLPVSLYLLTPCREYWADIVSPKEKARLEAVRGEQAGEGLTLLETGNDLLASLGRLGRDFQDLLLARGLLEQDTPLFTEPGRTTLLQEIQGDILNMTNPPLEGRGEFQPDDSVCIASCHTPMREVEVLHDYLLHQLEMRPELMPEDIVVMCPHIGAYAPSIQAVFGSHEGEAASLPFHIADQTREQEDPAIKGFFQILGLADSRFEVSAVLALLDMPLLRERAGLSAREVERVRLWVTQAGIHWGIDGAFKQALGLPGYEEHTWVAGMERMLLGVMMPQEVWKAEEGSRGSGTTCLVPFDRIEGKDALVLGRFLALLQTLFRHVRGLEQARTAEAWQRDLTGLVRDVMQPEEGQGQPLTSSQAEGVTDLVTGIEEVFAQATASGFTGELDFPAVRYLLTQALAEAASRERFLSGGVTFCTLQPMRSIPFSLVCLMGLSDGAFPRQERSPGFDLLRAAPRPGDRSLRMDDRYLFLEALISARDAMYFSYLGQDRTDNTPLPPSVLLSEFMDYLDRSYPMKQGRLADMLTTRHRLQGFHPRYFEAGSPLTSYVRENFHGAMKLREPQTTWPFIQGKLAEQEEGVRELSLDVLLAFWNNPARFLLRNRLGITLSAAEEGMQDVEPLEGLDALERYLLGQQLLRGDTKTREDAYLWAQGMHVLPAGMVGKQRFDALWQEVFSLRASMESVTGGAARLEPLTGTIACVHHPLYAVLKEVFPEGQVVARFARAKGKDFLNAWIQHLALQLLAPQGMSRTTWLIAKDGRWRFDALEGAQAVLDDLLALFDTGQNQCLPFFPESSLVFARTREKHLAQARTKARQQWEGSGYTVGEGEDASFSLCYRDVDPLDEVFEEVAARVFDPLLHAMNKEG